MCVQGAPLARAPPYRHPRQQREGNVGRAVNDVVVLIPPTGELRQGSPGSYEVEVEIKPPGDYHSGISGVEKARIVALTQMRANRQRHHHRNDMEVENHIAPEAGSRRGVEYHFIESPQRLVEQPERKAE